MEDCLMDKVNLSLLEQWAIAKYNKFGGEDWLDLVMYCVAQRAKEER